MERSVPLPLKASTFPPAWTTVQNYINFSLVNHKPKNASNNSMTTKVSNKWWQPKGPLLYQRETLLSTSSASTPHKTLLEGVTILSKTIIGVGDEGRIPKRWLTFRKRYLITFLDDDNMQYFWRNIEATKFGTVWWLLLLQWSINKATKWFFLYMR